MAARCATCVVCTRATLDLLRDEQAVREELRGRRPENFGTDELVNAHRLHAQQVRRGALVLRELEALDLRGGREAQGVRSRARQRGVHVLPRRLRANRRPHERQRIELHVIVAPVGVERVEAVVVGELRVGRPIEQVLDLAKELRAKSVAQLLFGDLPHRKEDLAVQSPLFRHRSERGVQRRVVDVTELAEDVPQVRDRLARAPLGGVAVEHEDRCPGAVGVRDFDRPGERALKHIHQHLDEGRLGERPFRGGRRQIDGNLSHGESGIECTRAVGVVRGGWPTMSYPGQRV